MSAIEESFSNSNNFTGSIDNDQRLVVSGGNDQYVSFDNFMGLPQTDFLPFQTPMPLDQPYSGMGPTPDVDGTESNTLASWPYTNPNTGAIDLDHDWTWVGNNPFTADWNNGINNGMSGPMTGLQ